MVEYMSATWLPHKKALQHLMKYSVGTKNKGLILSLNWKIHLTAEEPIWDPSTSEYSKRETHMIDHQGQISILSQWQGTSLCQHSCLTLTGLQCCWCYQQWQSCNCTYSSICVICPIFSSTLINLVFPPWLIILIYLWMYSSRKV